MRELTDQERQSLLELAVDMFCVAGTDGYLRWLNPRWTEVLGWTAEELTERPFIEFVHPEDVEATFKEVERLKEGLPAVQFTNRYRHRDGGWRWLEWNTVPKPDGTLFCTVRDVTRRKELEAERVDNNRLLRLAEEMGRVGHWRVDLTDNTVFWSDEVFRIHGVPLDEEVPDLEDAINAYHPEDRGQVSAALNEAIAARSGFEFELRLIQRGGAQRDVLSRGVCEVSELTGEVVAVFGVFIDVTEHKRAERVLQAQAERLKAINTTLGQFASIISHDLRAPLRGIATVLGWVLEELEEGLDEAKLREHLGRIEQRAQRMDRMLVSLHRFVRVERAEVDLEEVDVGAMARELLDDLPTEGFTVTLGELPTLRTARAPLRHTLGNLMSNAIKHHDLGRGRVEVRASIVGEDVWFEVEDDGAGVPERFQERIFEPLQTLKPRDQVEGSGMGLAIVRRIVGSCGGSVEVRSPVREGRGSRFVVRWPRRWPTEGS